MSRRMAYQSQTRLGLRANAAGVASSIGSNFAQRPVCASRNVGTPDSAETPAPVSTATKRADRSAETSSTGGDAALIRELSHACHARSLARATRVLHSISPPHRAPTSMSGNTFGTLYCVTSFGESHGPAIGCVVDGCPPGMELAAADIQRELDRRRPGTSRHVTQRRETDTVEILSGCSRDVRRERRSRFSSATRTSAARTMRRSPRPSARARRLRLSGRNTASAIYRGGGRASARETAVRVAAGAIAKKWLRERYGVAIRGHLRPARPACDSVREL